MLPCPALAVENVSVLYGKLAAVENLSFELDAGQIFGLLGPNGSGKSSTLCAIAGVLQPAAGSIRIQGACRKQSPRDYSQRVGFVPQSPALYEELSARDNLAFFGSLYGLRRRRLRERTQAALELVGLADRARDRVSTLSGGMVRRIHLAAALLHDPLVLLLDEPTVALDPASRDALFATLNNLRDAGRLVLFTTHHLDEAEQWCDSVGILRKGKLLAVGPPADVLRQIQPEAVLLGTLREELSEAMERTVRERLGSEVSFEVIGRRITLTAPDGERLGFALAALHAEGVELESFRTPPARLDRLACIHSHSEEHPSILPFPGGICRAS